MAREYARVKIGIWADAEFRRLSADGQGMYFLLITSPTMNLCGVADWRPKRLAALTADRTAADVERAVEELSEAGYVVVDDDTEEILVRSFVRHDGVIKTPNIAMSMAKDYAGVASEMLRGVIVHELLRLRSEEPSMKSWAVASDVLEGPSINPSDIPSFKASGNPSAMASPPKGSGMALAIPSGNGSHIPQPTTHSQQPAAHSPETRPPKGDSPEFIEFWATYPRRSDKGHARTAWAKAVRKADPETITAGAARFRDDPNREEKYTPLAATWLNGERWEDGPLPERPAVGNARDDALEAEWRRVHSEPELLHVGGDPWTHERP